MRKMPSLNETTTHHEKSYANNSGGSCKNNKSNVRFDRVEIRTYGVILGDNPGGHGGAPLSLSWNYDVLGHLPVERFEQERVDDRRRGQKNLWLGNHTRQSILSKAGYTDSEISQAEKNAQLIRHQRRSSYFKSLVQHPSFPRPKRTKIQHEKPPPSDYSSRRLTCLKGRA
jgi:hypothetical protein